MKTYILSIILFLISNVCQASATKNSNHHGICNDLIVGIFLPEHTYVLQRIESLQDVYVKSAEWVQLKGYLRQKDASEVIRAIDLEMKNIKNLIDNINTKHKQANYNPHNLFTKTRREAEEVFKQNLLRIYSNYIYVKQILTEHIKTEEEINELDIDAALDKEFNLEKLTLPKITKH